MRDFISGLLLVFVVLFMCSGCSPIEGFVNGEFGGNDYRNTLHKLELIARNSAIIYDPGITDEEFDEWVARHRESQRRFTALIDLYMALAPSDSLEDADEYQLTIGKAVDDLDAVVATRE